MSKKHLSIPYAVWMLIFVLIPLVLILFYGFTTRDGAFTMDNILSIAQPEHRKALWLSFLLSFISTAVCLLLSYPLAMILNKMSVNQNSFIVFIFILPMWMNFLLRTMAWQNILERNGILNRILEFFHLPALNLINTPYAIVLGMVYNFLPFMVLPIYNSLIRIDKDVINAAHDLGASNSYTFRKIIFPLTLPGVMSGILMVFIPAMTTFVISDLLGGGKILLIGNVIEQEFKQANNWNLGSGLSLVLMLFIVISMIVDAVCNKDEEERSLW
ncbi:MAG: ABC transporter permease [Lachnospiraceae bacterium]|nr:ABC transporter permease [Lachnospiraceae bacterium]